MGTVSFYSKEPFKSVFTVFDGRVGLLARSLARYTVLTAYCEFAIGRMTTSLDLLRAEWLDYVQLGHDWQTNSRHV
jgi:hypothetical protein